jgi:hypothetical protein
MPITYHCDNCDVTSDSLDGWIIVSVMFIHNEPNVQPSGRTLDSTAPDLLFHAVTCRDAWCTKAGVAPPVTVST